MNQVEAEIKDYARKKNRESKRRYHEEHYEQHLYYQRQYYWKHREERLIYQREYERKRRECERLQKS